MRMNERAVLLLTKHKSPTQAFFLFAKAFSLSSHYSPYVPSTVYAGDGEADASGLYIRQLNRSMHL